ncbi:hypothetical protein [Pseudomonas amygdali]|uniref:Uncharacterized protein n=2 Tax=Pseudomonas amygdali pv. lachrymans TaxID=53707 RepID=A0ABR5KSZ1_PSEAV|nr:hypothetical protein [Pseudomonas amygdali]AXH59544.1 hypothetical protein PLA107_030425 [Pseudomonas amygdali pv. lachrymans str. M301315]KPC16973.1 Uncharacterized protein AC499_0175 [Pseudomonas amygdali pv. lachrymans]KPC17932.1 Uncharacterized protein AC499_1134 [Pseudomonas amygdali pv. lachrymans]RMT06296.1 hypothetical protein ALP54_03467 [Pseudomonas amygdali pv. lachrymans]
MNTISLEEAQRILNQLGYECREVSTLVESTKGTGLSASALLEKTFKSAQRWEAFIRSARLRVLGSAGFREPQGAGGPKGYRHFGMEFWTHYDASFELDNSHEVKLLEAYADAMTGNLSDAQVHSETCAPVHKRA